MSITVKAITDRELWNGFLKKQPQGHLFQSYEWGDQKANLKATYLLQYQCFQWAKTQGCRFFDFRAIPELLEPGEEMWNVYLYKKGFGGFSHLTMPTQDYIYRLLLYKALHAATQFRARRQHAAHT